MKKQLSHSLPSVGLRRGIFSALCALALFFSVNSYAADLVSVNPVTDRILMVYIEDGHIDYYGSGQGISDNVTYHNPVDLGRAMTKSNYKLSSTNDGNYGSSGKSPINMGRKSREKLLRKQGIQTLLLSTT